MHMWRGPQHIKLARCICT